MQLVCWNNNARHFAEIRELSSEEITKHKQYVPIFKEAENRLSLFKILNKNYKQWDQFIGQLISPDERNFNDDCLELQRLLLNYLTAAYTIGEHFEVSYNRRYKKRKGSDDEYAKFVEELCAKSSDYAFISDYRGYVQHVGLGVENYQRNITATSVTLVIEVRPSKVAQFSRSWEKSKLTKDSPAIELVGTLQRYHMVVLDSYAPFVAQTFYPELVAADKFYAGLLGEVRKVDQGARMYFSPEKMKVKDHGSVKSGTLQWIGVPNNVYQELGISVRLPTAALSG